MIIFSVGSGLRVSETERLTFGDIEVVTVNGEKTLKIMVKDGKTGTRSVLTENSSYHAIIKLKELYLRRGLKIDKSTNVFQTKTFSGALRRLLISCGLRTCKRTGKIIDGKSWRQTYISWEVIKGKRSLLWIANNCGNSVGVIQSNYANNLQHEDFFEEKLNAISII